MGGGRLFGGSAFFFSLPAAISAPVLASSFSLPAVTTLDARLLGGSALFGIGWGLTGYCPGPAVASLPGLSLSS